MLILAVSVAAAAACASGRHDPAVARGRAFVQQSCAGCHAVGLEGASPQPAGPAFRRLRGRVADADLAARLAQISRDGHVQMPPIYMTEAEIADVVAYVRAVEDEAPEVDAPPPEGRRVRLAAPAPVGA